MLRNATLPPSEFQNVLPYISGNPARHGAFIAVFHVVRYIGYLRVISGLFPPLPGIRGTPPLTFCSPLRLTTTVLPAYGSISAYILIRENSFIPPPLEVFTRMLVYRSCHRDTVRVVLECCMFYYAVSGRIHYASYTVTVSYTP